MTAAKNTDKQQAHNALYSRAFLTAVATNFLVFFVITSFVLYPLQIKASGGSDVDIGTIMGVFSLVSVLVRPISGVLADRGGYRKLTLFGLVIMTLCLPGFALVDAIGWPVLILRACLGLGWACVVSPLMALATRLVPQQHLSQALGVYGISGLLANAAAPVFGEWLAQYEPPATLHGINAFVLLLATVLVFYLPKLVTTVPESHSAAPGLRSWPWLALGGALLLAVLHGSVRGTNINFIGPYTAQLQIGALSPYFVAFTLAALLTRLTVASLPDRFGRRKVAIPVAALIAINTLLLSRIDGVWGLMGVGFVGGFAQGLIFPALSALIIDLVGQGHRALALSLYAVFFELGFGLGLPVFGVIADQHGYRNMFVVSALAMAIGVLVFAVTTRGVREQVGSQP